MKKKLIPTLISLSLLLILILSRQAIYTSFVKQYPKGSSPLPGTKPDNIDSLVKLICKNKFYPIQAVYYGSNTLFITIAGESASARYFDSAYHLSTLRSIDEIKIRNTQNRQLDAENIKNARMLTGFEEKWCSGNECLPLTARIKQELGHKSQYRSIRLWIDWLADSCFVVVDSFQLTDTAGRPTTQKVLTEIDMQGKMWVYDKFN